MGTDKRVFRKPAHTKKTEQPIIGKLKERHAALSGNTRRKRGIKFSDYTDISVDNKCLHIHIAHKNKNYPVACNMQTDGAAFEGWAICLKSWLPDEIHNVFLTWDKPEGTNGHYNRFLYRVWRFSEIYDWFGYDDPAGDVEDFKIRFTGSRNNSGDREPGMKAKECEEQVEHYMVARNQAEFISRFDLEGLHRHLPVGIKNKAGKSLFTGRNSAIDLWGIGRDSVLNLFELKYIKEKNASKNIKVGIVSELLLYVNIMNDIRLGVIDIPRNTKLKTTADLYGRIRQLKGVKGIFLTNELHPLLEYGVALDLLNANKKNIPFEFADYGWNAKEYRVSFR